MKKFLLSLFAATCAFAQPYSPTTTPLPYGLSEQDVVFRQNLVGRGGVTISHSNTTTYVDGTGVSVTNTTLATNTYNVVNQYYNTNWASLNLNTIYVDGISGNDGYPGTFDLPKLTPLAAQTIATSGQTVCILRGTFVVSGLGKPGVEWYISRGVVLDGGTLLTQGVFALGKYNLVTPAGFELVVKGEGTFTNIVINLTDSTNGTVRIDSYSMSSMPSSYLTINETASIARTNVVTLSATRSIEGQYFYGATTPHVHENLDLTFNAPIIRVTAPSLSFATNSVVTFNGGLLTPAGTSGGIFPSGLGSITYRVNTARFSRGGAAMSSSAFVTTNTYFNNVVVLSSNADFSATLFNNVKGTYRLVNP